jgi:exopolysaccharide biosynthesis operon protein EpsL
MTPGRRDCSRVVIALATLAASPAAPAQSADEGLSFSASQAVRHESNLFRLPDGIDPNLILGRPSTAESIDITTLRMRYAKDYSLQHIEIDLSLVNYRYRTYKAQDQLAQNYGLEWRWALTPRLTGKVRADRNTAVSGFDNASTVSSRNESVRRYEVIDASYELDGAWRALAAVQHTRNIFAQSQVGEDGSSLRSGELGLRYQAPTGSAVTLRLRQGHGQTLKSNQSLTPQNDNDFNQTEQLLDLRWQMSAKTLAEASLGLVERDHDRDASRDFSGTNTSLSLSWAATAKTRWAVRASSEIGSNQTSASNFVRTNRLGLSYDWQIGAHTNLQLSVAQSRRSFGGAQPGQAPNTLRDSTREMSVMLRWSPTRNITLETSLQHTGRRSNQASQAFSNLQTNASISALF